MTVRLHGLVAATHTPFDAHGDLNLAIVEKQAELMLLDERLALAKRWSEVVRGTPLVLVVHVGSNCLRDARTMAAQAQSIGAAAIAAVTPCYFKPRSLDTLVACCAEIAAAAPATPFYYYDIPILTGVLFSMPEFLNVAPARIPTLVGLKFTNADLMAFQRCLRAENGRFDVPWGTDEYLLGALALGAQGAVGSSYNFTAPLYLRLIAAYNRGDLAAARAEQFRSVQLIDLLAGLGYMAAAKTVMGLLGVEVGPARLPNTNLTVEQTTRLRTSLEQMGFFDWIRP
jgi:N-acetylneuraminate lyase